MVSRRSVLSRDGGLQRAESRRVEAPGPLHHTTEDHAPYEDGTSESVATPTSRLAELHPAWLHAVCVTRCEFFAWTRSPWNPRERGRSGAD